ncbi:MAG: hypothetical protein UW81_C0015G0016 [Candidatus Giovannonibacteria bacterium GW2011_GWC2_44_9]|uniref:MurNAc-LAA domain-containing protein n=3 Tax=Candidatus Giovannoniibacteriota TaxID=1752738 RepID=A0A0G1L5Y8_9BACT|nr:MAG: hypothetical protein UW49_C0004G0108 [Candidatus Giovannonibacteria bacterium GW2011_GWB1_44_23]KKT63997.1 MAG: hypothetical protein UW57_C0004G0107 [Candidatus Giovannonibacteria bacterium GW2011_GWA1_44_29]KKT83594.1 MAG: hypothetical protein UW81_C0015G0016 [Candidatus Giovannonibacteria bacterium GW2011_GWC2_44_9]KKT91190.1 MAG: hypothetical protein UW93_C0011G0014 [Parcubacteria group bacterium GW2011_GWC1_45_13]OGF95816.1 MAG: hypothetical protein A2613_03260 [Candidatus Giovannon
MLKHAKLVILAILILIVAYYFDIARVGTTAYYLAGVFFGKEVRAEELLEKYKNGEVKILIVPGHDKKNYGAQYRGVTEASLNAELGNYLFDSLRNNGKFSVFITNNSSGERNDWILDYVKSQNTAIAAFKEKVKTIFKNAVKIGAVTKETKVFHNPAADNISQILYGINKWANDNGMDIVLHIHFNDYPGRTYDMPGKYKGFAIYVPDNQFPNGKASMEIAGFIKNELEKIVKESNFPGEKDVLIEDQQLIAVGSNASREGVSLLIEYGYIYESKLLNKDLRPFVLRELAEATHRGLANFFKKY